MKLLLDSCLSAITAAALRDYGHDVIWTGDWADDPGDPAILAIAHRERRILITIDKDFGKLAVLERRPHSVESSGSSTSSQTSMRRGLMARSRDMAEPRGRSDR